MLKGRPQGHVLGKPDIDLLYRSANASLNSCLFSTYPSSSKGRTFSQLDVPFSESGILFSTSLDQDFGPQLKPGLLFSFLSGF